MLSLCVSQLKIQYTYIFSCSQVQAEARRINDLRQKGQKVKRKDQNISTVVLITARWNMSSSLCNYFGFFKIYEGTYTLKYTLTQLTTTTKNACSCFFPLLGIHLYNCVCVCVCASNSDVEPSVTSCLIKTRWCCIVNGFTGTTTEAEQDKTSAYI